MEASNVRATNWLDFMTNYNEAHKWARVSDSCTAPDDVNAAHSIPYLTTDALGGFAVSSEGELTCLFSLVKGRGHALVKEAIRHGATKLDCFDGYLVTLYTEHGFREVKRDANWTAGGPDVVWMVR